MIKLDVSAQAVGAVRMFEGLVNRDRWIKILRSVIAVIGIKDIVGHFEREEGPEGKWAPLNPSYDKWRRKKGKTKILQFSGTLKGAFLPSNMRSDRESVTVFNPVEYAGKHDRGEDGMPQRKFMWLSDKATELVHQSFVDRLLA